MADASALEKTPKSYGIVTPVRNELRHISTLFSSVQAQEWRPALWIIADDGSTDGSAEALDEAAAALPWVVVHHRSAPRQERRESLGAVLRDGVERGQTEVRQRGLHVGYWAILDADVLLPPEYFRRLHEAFEANPRLGICSGTAQFGPRPSRLRAFLDLSDEPQGMARLWRLACLEEIGGVPAIWGWDVISNALAVLHGWKIDRFSELRVQTRRMFEVEGVWNMQLRGGEQTAMLGYPPSFAFVRAARLLVSKNGIASAAFLAGYLRARARRVAPTVSSELLRYFKKRSGGAVIRERLRLLQRMR